MKVSLLFVLSLAGSLLIQVPHTDAAPCFQAINGENLWRLTSQLGDCLNVIEECCSTVEECCSTVEEQNEEILSSVDSVSSKIDILNSNLEVLTASSLDEIQSNLECIASNVEFICSESECLITTFSLLESLSENIVANLSDVEQIFNQVVSAIDVSTSVISELIESTSEVIISSIDVLLISEVEACCNLLVSEIESSTDQTVSAVATCCTSILSVLDTTTSGVDICCDVILSALDKTAISVVSSIDEVLESSLDASVSAICVCVESAQEIISAQIDAITGSTLEGIVSLLDVLSSGVDALCSDLDCVVEKFSLIESLSDEALNNISSFDSILEQTVSAVDIVIKLLEDPTCGIVALCSNIDTLQTSLTACCDSINNNIDTCCTSINNNIDNCCEDLRTRIDGLFGVIGTGFLDVLSAIAEVSGLVSEVIDIVDPTEDIVKDIQTKVDSLISSSDMTVSGIDTLTNCLVGTPITNADLPFVISMPGKYFVCEALNSPGETAITITSGFVELDLNGFNIRADTGVAITATQLPIYIHNGSITADTFGITATGSSDITINNVRVLDAPAFDFNACQNLTLDSCIAIYDEVVVSAFPLFNFEDCTDIVVTNCSASGTTMVGGYSLVGTTSNVTMENCVALGNTTNTVAGFLVAPTVTSVVLRGCTAQSCAGAGFGFQPIAGLQAIGCVAESCSVNGFLINDASKILCVECTARDNGVNGFNIFGSSTILLERCCAFANGTADITIDATSTNVQVIESCATTIDNASSTTTILNLETAFECAVGTIINQLELPYIITAPGTYVLCGNVFVEAVGNAITINANNVILDLNGFDIDGVSGLGTNGIVVTNRESIQIKNGSISNFSTAGINITAGTDIVIEDLIITTNLGKGINVSTTSANITIRNCSLVTNLMPCISIDISSNVIVDGCLGVSDSAVPAIFSSTGNAYTTYKNSTARSNGFSTTIGFENTLSDTNVVIENCIAQNVETGYSLNGVTGFTLINNRALSIPAGGSAGFSVGPSVSNNGVIQNCIVESAVTPGFVLTNGNNISLTDCQAINTAGGFIFTNMASVIVENCESNLSTTAGFLCTSTQQVYLGNCRVNKSSQVAYGFGTAIGSTMENCTANSSGAGISLVSSTGSVIRDCTLVQSLGTGISLQNGSSQNTVQGCVVDGASVNGYTISNSNDIVVTECQTQNVAIGFQVNAAVDIVLRNCIVDTATSSSGFLLNNVVDVAHDGCTAIGCLGNGFTATTATNIVYRTCTANANVANGFSLIGTTNVLFCQCIAHANAVGINIAATCNNTKVIETCIGNNTVDIIDNGMNTEIVNIETVVSLIEALSAASTCCPMMITSLPAVINTPGLYCVCQTLSYVSAVTAAITINADDVILDLKQNLLARTTPNATGTGQAILCNGSGCIIENGLIDSDGIVVSGANVTVRDITITTATSPTHPISLINFQVGSSAGIVENCTIQGSTVIATGIEIAAPGSSVLNCEVTGCDIGFLLDIPALNTVVKNCRAISDISGGFIISASGVVIQECIAISSTGSTGFFVTGHNVQLYDSVATDSAVQGFLLSGNLAFVTGCSARSNGGNGFEIGGNGTSLINNSAITNSGYGFLVDNVASEATFTLVPSCTPTGFASFGTWTTTNGQNTILANNTALRNALIPGIAMTGMVTDTGTCPAVPYIHVIFPPLGIVNNTDGGINPDPFPKPGIFVGVATAGPATTVPQSEGQRLQAATNGNLMDPPGVIG